jgi:hypothetical protein
MAFRFFVVLPEFVDLQLAERVVEIPGVICAATRLLECVGVLLKSFADERFCAIRVNRVASSSMSLLDPPLPSFPVYAASLASKLAI